MLASRPCHLRFRSPRHLCPWSFVTFVPGSPPPLSLVRRVCVPGRLGLCPWSEGFVSPVRSFVGDRGRQNAQNAENRRRSRAKMRTGDGTLLDLGRKTPGPATESALTCDGRTDRGRYVIGPGTESALTCDGRTADESRHEGRHGQQARKQARRQDESRHGTRQEWVKKAGNGWDVGKNDYICGISTDINLLTL